MIDLSACQVTAAGRWGGLSWRLYNVLVQPQLILPLLAALIAAPRAFSGWRFHRQTSLVGVGLLLAYLMMMTPLAARLGDRGLAVLIATDDGQPADAIVVLGRGHEFRPSRVQVAADLWQQQRAPLIFASGRGDALEISQMLEAAGVPPAAIEGEPCSATTNENAEFTAALLEPQGVKRLILVTDSPHMARSVWTFRSLGFEVVPHVSPMPQELDRHRQRFLVFREWGGLISYGLMGRYFARQVPEPSFSTSLTPLISRQLIRIGFP